MGLVFQISAQSKFLQLIYNGLIEMFMVEILPAL